jgi:hypothetical protein
MLIFNRAASTQRVFDRIREGQAGPVREQAR